MTTFKTGHLVVPLDDEQRRVFSSQRGEEVGPFPWKVYASEGHGRDEFLSFEFPDGDYRGYYAFRFKLAPTPDKSLEDYM